MVSSVSAQVKVFIDQNLSPAANSKRLASIAVTARDRLIAAGQASPKYDTYVDGQLNGPINNVQKYIAFKFQYANDAVQFAIQNLIKLSPPPGPTGNRKGGGHYRDSFMISNGTSAVPAASFDYSSVKSGDTIIIYNNQPYGRKVDVQMIGGEKMTFSVPPNLFAKTVSAMRTKYGQAISVQRLYTVNVVGQWIRKTGKKRSNGLGRLVEYPALEITIR